MICSGNYTARKIDILTESEAAAPVSLTIACRLFFRSHAATGSKVGATLSITHSSWSPELSISRYLCKSKIKFVVDLSGFVILAIAAPHPLLMKVPALEKVFPGRRMM